MNLVEPIRDLKKIKEFRKQLSPKYLVIWDIGSKIGIRVSDILALNLDIIGKEVITIREKKTGKLKKFPLCPELQKEIFEYYQNYRKKQFSYNEKALFVGRQGERLDRSAVYREFNKAANILGIENMGTHTMRKTFGYHHYKQYHDIIMLQQILNHSSPQITLRYIGITQDEIMKSYKNFQLNSESAYRTEQIIELRNETLKNQKAIRENKPFAEIIENIINTKLEAFNQALIDTLNYIQKNNDKKLDKILKELCY